METVGLRVLAECRNQILSGEGVREGELGLAVADYNVLRNRLLANEVRERGEDWCMGCENLFPRAKLVFVFFEGAEPVSEGGEFEGYYRIMRACCPCSAKTVRESRSVHFYEYATETKDGMFCVTRGGLPIYYARPYALDVVPPKLADRMTDGRDFPPRLEVVLLNGREILKENGVPLRVRQYQAH